MPSKAKQSFDSNATDIERLLDLHSKEGGEAPGRRYGLEVLNKSAIVLISAFWEAYCEDLASEGLEHVVRQSKSSQALPEEIKKQIAKSLKSASHELEIWKVADDGWKTVMRSRFADLKSARDRKLNTPKTSQINELFLTSVGMVELSASWKWPNKMSSKRAAAKLDKFVTLRGSIAHRGLGEKAVTKKEVTDFFEFAKKLVEKSDDAVNDFVKTVTGKSMY